MYFSYMDLYLLLFRKRRDDLIQERELDDLLFALNIEGTNHILIENISKDLSNDQSAIVWRLFDWKANVPYATLNTNSYYILLFFLLEP